MTAFVLGNGISRRDISIDLLFKNGTVYGCNALYRTHVPYALVATDQPIAESIQKSGYALKHRFYTRRPISGSGALIVPEKYRGFSSGPIATSIAAIDGHTKIYLVGFDMGPSESGNFNNVYADTEFYKKSDALPTYTGNWIRQLTTVINDFSTAEFVRVVGKTTANIESFDLLKNFKKMSIDEFLNRINTTPKDL